MGNPVIIEAVRTPFAKFRGAYRDTRPDSLLAHAIKGVVERAGLNSEKVEDVVAGVVTQTGEQGMNIGKFATIIADLPAQTAAVTINRACGSSQEASHMISRAINANDITYGIGCGVESMTRVQMFSDIDPEGKFTGLEMLNPEIFKRFALVKQGESAELIAEKYDISRQELDAFAKESHRRAHKAATEGLNREIIATLGVDKEGNSIEVIRDEGVRANLDDEKMASLPTVFRPDGNGVVTPGNASQLADGAAALLIGDEEVARADGLTPRARFRARVAVGGDPILQLMAVVPATKLALKKAGLKLQDVDWIEINEAFASVVLAWSRELNPNMDRVNPWGGAVAHGHALGATGAGLMAKMLAGLEATNGSLGLQVMCIATGQATASIIERI
jgi:acetyl-CoA acyltransferase